MVQVILGGVVVVGVTVAAGGHRFTRCDHQHSYQHFHCALIKGERVKEEKKKTLIGKRVSRRTNGQNERQKQSQRESEKGVAGSGVGQTMRHERERQRQTETDRETQTETERQNEREREGGRERDHMHDQFIYKQHVYPASVVCFMLRLLCFLAAFCLFVFVVVVDVVFASRALSGPRSTLSSCQTVQ